MQLLICRYPDAYLCVQPQVSGGRMCRAGSATPLRRYRFRASLTPPDECVHAERGMHEQNPPCNMAEVITYYDASQPAAYLCHGVHFQLRSGRGGRRLSDFRRFLLLLLLLCRRLLRSVAAAVVGRVVQPVQAGDPICVGRPAIAGVPPLRLC